MSPIEQLVHDIRLCIDPGLTGVHELDDPYTHEAKVVEKICKLLKIQVPNGFGDDDDD